MTIFGSSRRRRSEPDNSTISPGASATGCASSAASPRLITAHLVEQRDAVGLGPQPDLSRIGKRRILDLEHLPAVEGCGEARAFEVDAQAVPDVGWYRDGHAVAALSTDDIQRAADAVDRLVEHEIVLQRIGASDVIVVGIPCAPDYAGGAILRAGQRLERHLDKAVFDADAVFQQQWEGGPARLPDDFRPRWRGVIAFDRPLRIARAGEGGGPTFRRNAGAVALESDRVV